MNKIFNINLGGYPCTIDEDAYEELKAYLKAIRHHFRSSEGYEEIVADIETRMAELFQENLNGRPIITNQDVEIAISIMGTPEDFGAEIPEEEKVKTKSSKFNIKTGKRLFKDTNDQVVGGVCSGIAAYFGIEDPLWVRLFFVLITISGGFGIIAYLILWAILPKAETAADRLSMKGEKINVASIAKTIEEEIDHFSDKISEWGDEIGSKKKAKKKKVKYETV